MNDFEIAIYNQCCVAKNWTDQAGAFGVCTGNNTADCPAVTDPDVIGPIPDATLLFCACAYSGAKLASFESAIQSTGFCSKAQNAIIDTDGLVLPSVIPGNLKLITLTAQKDGADFVYHAVPLVGWQKLASNNPDPVDAEEHPLPHGCGIGYQKGLAWMTDLWFQQNTLTPAYASISIGVVNLALVALALVISHLQLLEERERTTGKVDKWDTVKDIPSTFANTTNPVHQPIVAYPVGATTNGHNDSLEKKAAAIPLAASGPSKEEIFEQLRNFYAKYEKNKNVADVEDVAVWTVTNGIPALNAKLMSKYNADLNTIGSMPSTGIGAKALQKDLDI